LEVGHFCSEVKHVQKKEVQTGRTKTHKKAFLEKVTKGEKKGKDPSGKEKSFQRTMERNIEGGFRIWKLLEKGG